MENITILEISFARKYNYYPVYKADFIVNVAIKLMHNVPIEEILKYPITYAREDYYAAAQKISDLNNTNNIMKVFQISTFKGLNTLHTKCMAAIQKQSI